ncbi:TrmH family RNA methyltransferase [Candidatus Uhrbacteria bacterium]|nr:TrmH family RNA methyltransferase [Candidatus Uhrbacteria bacterium]
MELHLIANDIRSAQNVGSLLRTCDSLGVDKLWLTGYSPEPSHPRVAKTALGAESSVDWEQAVDVTKVIAGLRRDGFRIIGLELDQRAVDLATYVPPDKVALLLGNEVDGIPPSLRALCDELVYIEQNGKKESMNVAVAAGIAAYTLLRVS